MNHHILITILSLVFCSRPAPEELRISSLSTGVRDSRQVFVGVENRFLVEDSSNVAMVSHPNARFTGKTLTIVPNFTGPLELQFVKDGDTMEVQFQSRILALAQARPSMAQSKSISKLALSRDSTVIFEVNTDDDYYKGFKLAHFVGCINNLSFVCDTSFCPGLMEAVRQSGEGDLLKITAFELVHEETGRTMKIRCNTPFTITP